MQGPSNLTDAMAEATIYWSTVWTGPDPTPCSYIDAGLMQCKPADMCPDLVRHIFRQIGDAQGEEWERSLRKAVVSSMCWLHCAGISGFDGFEGLVQCLSAIRRPLAASALHMLRPASLGNDECA